MKMKKLLALMLALVMVFALAACGTDSGEPSSEPTTGASAEPSSVPSEGGDTAESDMAYVKEKGTLIVGITEFEPMDYQNAEMCIRDRAWASSATWTSART